MSPLARIARFPRVAPPGEARLRRLVVAVVAAGAALFVGGADGAGQFKLSSPAFRAGAAIPKLYTCDGRNVSPALRWTAPPRGTRSLALVVHDPDAPGQGFTHWIAYNLPSSRRGLPAAAKVRFEGVNDAGQAGYTGPCPPSGTHRYVFRLYAVSWTFQLKVAPSREVFLNLLRGRVLATATLVGRYGR